MAERAAKRPRLTGTFVTIRAAGGKSENITVHQNLLRDSSAFFRTAVNFLPRGGLIDLSEDEPATIEDYVQYLYGNEIATTPTKELDVDGCNKQYQHLARLYCFGEKVESNDFCNAVISTVLKLRDARTATSHSYNPIQEAVKIIYDGTPVGSPARELMVFLHVEIGHDKWVTKDHTKNHPDFLVDCLHAFMAKRGPGPSARQLYEDRKVWFKEV